jgi:hypothetical protein
MSARRAVIPFRSRRTRRDEVADRLAILERTCADEVWASSLRATLDALGPVFSGFGRYLGSRIDLLHAGDCAELMRCTPTLLSADSVHGSLFRELGPRASHVAQIDTAPVRPSWLTQTHRGRLLDGMPVHIEMLTSSTEHWVSDEQLLPLLDGACARRIPSAVLRSAIADFGIRIRQDVDLTTRLADVDVAARECERGSALTVPRLCRELCTPRLLVTEAIDVDPVEETIASDVERTPWEARPHDGVARWLRQALVGDLFPVFLPGEALEVHHGTLVTATRWAHLKAATQQRLLAHLFAVAADAPDRSWAALQPELVPVAGAAPPEQVERAFRRMVPFRDDRTGDSGSSVADHVFLQWRLASQHGWLPASHLVPFYQSLVAVMQSVNRQSGMDLLEAALRELRWTASLRQLDAVANQGDMLAGMERQMLLLMELPQKLDRLLTVAAEGGVRVQLAAGDGVAPRPHRSAGLVVVLFVAAGLLIVSGSPQSVRQVWETEPVRSIGLVAAGALLAWMVGRIR